MKTLVNLLFIFSVFVVQSCIQAPSNTRKSSLTSSATTNSGNAGAPTFAADETAYWFTTSKYTGTLTVNKNSQDIVYLRGKFIHDFLNAKDISGVLNYRKQFCLVGNFSSVAYKQIRVRAIPIFVTTSTKAIERLLRIDIPSSADNTSACKFSTIDNILPVNAAFSLADINSSNSGQITTKDLTLYLSQASSLTKIDNTALNLSSVLLKVDLSSNSNSSASSCTNSSCSAKGFDCCISGQCVMDASEKSNASIDPQYAQAKAEYASNPLSFINYPNIFFICSNIAHTPSSSSSGSTSTATSDAQARVAKYLTDYTCTTDVTAGNGYNNCRNLSTNGAPTGLDKTESAYTAIKKKLAIACGCSASDSEMAYKCPDWGVIPVYKTGALQTTANITDFNCYTPAPANPIGPITNLNLSVPNRSSPHRFYSSAGVNYDDIATLFTKSPTMTQEGDDFYYLDEANKAGPVNNSFNINSVIGRMTIDLSHALPAKVVNVELGKTYIVSATSGYFTPCSQCAKDSWFQSFSAHPNSQRGLGLQAQGYSTSRDTYAGNSTFGNYEDTKFGRACYVPVTMLAYSHRKDADLQKQRQARLKTQAAYFINGYQRDWYGFNMGALIGSFDGVNWFAIGSGRRTTATSTKLYLAINAPFLDLAAKTDTVVNIIPDFSANTAADYDYDPELKITDPRQNTAATCQQYHQCNADADCVAQLGWEYVCADISQVRTKWPIFDTDAKETVNQETVGSLFDILSNTISTSNGKRCIYRGQGAPCKRDYTTPSTLSTLNRKALTCAPNFYCAALSANAFNDELVRSPNEMDNILYGMEANVLGRPLQYSSASRPLSSDIQTNIKYNATGATGLSSGDADDMGICRPGRNLSVDDKRAHSTPDTGKRTDYISQIGSCDSSSIGSNRFVTCPAFDDNLNYITSNSDLLNGTRGYLQHQTQNSCGGEAKNTTTGVSGFSGIEGSASLQNITQPILVQNACLRRAGSVCHTDLDCGPNSMHEQLAGSLSLTYFGGNDAEQQYWKESLICGQGTPQPAFGSSGYFDYKLSANRCCREIGKDFTMYTAGPSSLVPENAGNTNLDTGNFSFKNPNAANRYSRYTISKEADSNPNTLPKVSSTAEPKSDQWRVINETGSLTCCGGGWIRKFSDGTHDWKVRNRLTMDTANFSCLNFRSPLADATFSNFAAYDVNQSTYQREYSKLCQSPDIKGCVQIPFQESNGFTILSPRPYDPASAVIADQDGLLPSPPSGTSRLDTTPIGFPSITGWFLNADAPYQPTTYTFTSPRYDANMGQNQFQSPFFTNYTFDYGVEFYLPSYIGWDGTNANTTFTSRVYIKYFYDNTVRQPDIEYITFFVDTTTCNTVFDYNGTNQPVDNLTPDVPVAFMPRISNSGWCIGSSPKTGNRPVMIVRADTSGAHANWSYASVVYDFKPLENVQNTKVAVPGNPFYYLTKLGRLELLGIPQITYEPLFCNSDQNKLVPGIFKSTSAAPLNTRAQFQAASTTRTYIDFDPFSDYLSDDTPGSGYNNNESRSGAQSYGNYDKLFTYQTTVDHAAVFSAKDFTCCTPLGKTTSSATKCCSGYAVTSSDGKVSTCKLPVATDLNVYFNKFVSGEGVGDTQPGGGLVVKGTVTSGIENTKEVDFNPFTGEPKFRQSTYDKLTALGNAYCSSGKIGVGGAFGSFRPEPDSGSYITYATATGGQPQAYNTSIVDSLGDIDPNDPNLGKAPFDNGYRWNHHLYCK